MTTHRHLGINCLFATFVCVFLAGFSSSAWAKKARPAVAILAFGGENGEAIRSSVIKGLGNTFQIIDGQYILEACNQLGIPMSRGPNLARAATKIGVGAVIGGTIKSNVLHLAVYSGATGQPLTTGKVECPGYLTGGSLKKAVKIIKNGLRRAPKRTAKIKVVKEAPAAAITPAAPPSPPPAPPPPQAPTFAPEPVTPSAPATPAPAPPTAPGGAPAAPEPDYSGGAGKSTGSAGGMSFEPEPVFGKGQGSRDEENPLGPAQTPTPAPPSGGSSGAMSFIDQTPPEPKAPPEPHTWPYLGVGAIMRSFSLSDARFIDPKYNSGAAFAFRLGARSYPLAYFLDDKISTRIFLQFRYSQVIGLESAGTRPNPSRGTFSYKNSINEFLLDLGYSWYVLDKQGPRVDFILGYGMFNFGIDWGNDIPSRTKCLPQKTSSGITEKPEMVCVPEVGYKFLSFGLGAGYPLVSWLQLEASIAYRHVLDAGKIALDDPWYGPTTGGALNLNLGTRFTYKHFFGTLDYSFTRYGLSFSAAETHYANTWLTAGGALDLVHGIFMGAGYWF